MAIKQLPIPRSVPALVDGRGRPIGNSLRQYLSDRQQETRTAIASLSLATNVNYPTVGAGAIVIDLQLATTFEIIATVAELTIANPINPNGLSELQIILLNATAAPLTVSFGSQYRQAGQPTIGPGQYATVRFSVDVSTNPPTYVQIGAWSPAL